MESHYRDYFIRNIGIFTETEQEQLKTCTIAVAGVGGVGGLLIERLVRIGVGKIKMTDLGTFETSNINRQYGAAIKTIDRHKADVVYEQMIEINPSVKIEFDNKGINTMRDAELFIENCDLVIDEMDYGAWKESIYLQRAARRKGIYYAFAGAIGFGALMVNFDPKGITLEEYNNLPPDQDLEQCQTISVPIERVLPVVPTYVTNALSMEMIQEIISGQRPVPTCSVGTGLASILAASNAVNILLNKTEIIKAPRYIYVDLLDYNFLTGSM
ncbi:MAG: ThiF family adenylyltransferase [Syntrophomonadaceae bacterium]